MRKTSGIFAIFLIFFAGAVCEAAKEFSISLPAGSSVTMGDSSASLTFRVSNNSTAPDTGKRIRAVQFAFASTVYNISSSTTAPSGWDVNSIDNSTSPATVCFTVSGGGGISAGDSLVFNVAINGPSGGSIAAATQDMTDILDAGSTTAKDAGACGPEFTLTSSSSWSRKSLAIDLSATPSSLGTGGTVTLTMQVTNRSSAAQSSITATPAPPVAYLYGLTTLNLATSFLSSTATTITVASTSDFPSSGTIRIDSEEINCTGKTATTFTGCTRGVNGTTASFHANNATVRNRTSTAAVSISGGPTYGKSPFNLAPGESSTILWTYTSNSTATLYFSSSARNSTSLATSRVRNSNRIVIGNFTSVVSISPLSMVSGQSVTVTMVVTNNGASALGNVTPTLITGGTSTRTLVSGPTPASITSLGAGQSGSFTWTYNISGSAGQTYFFSGYATSGASTTNTSVSETGSITTYAVTVSPDVVATGGANVQIAWTVYNRGSRPVKQVSITYPSGWTYGSATAPDWAESHVAPTVTFTAGTQIPVGESKVFYITFSSVPNVTSDTPYTFPVTIVDQINITSTVNANITVTAYVIALVYSPAGPINADGTSKYTLTATLTKGGAPVIGVGVAFTTTAGTLSASTATTDASGIATVDLRSPCSQININTTINATYLNAGDPKTLSPAFSGISSGTLVYVGGSLTPKSPTSIATGYTGGFTLQLTNCGTTSLTINKTTLPDTNTSFAFASDTFELNAASYTIAAGATQTIGFSGTVSSSDSLCAPTLTVNAGIGYTGPFSYNKASPGDTIGDKVLIGSGTTCTTAPTAIEILDWREIY